MNWDWDSFFIGFGAGFVTAILYATWEVRRQFKRFFLDKTRGKPVNREP